MTASEIIKTLQELRTKKNNGQLDDLQHPSSDKIKWRDILAYELLEEYVKSTCDEIKFLTLSLLVESKKSTLSFTENELNVILIFVKFNIDEKFEFIPLLKKALQRLHNSTAVFKRNILQAEKFKATITDVTDKEQLELYNQRNDEYEKLVDESKDSLKIYEKFFINLREFCVNCLFLSATHSRKENSLKILDLQQTIWGIENDNEMFDWTREQATKLFECLLLDTYETNKIIVFRIISFIKPSTLQLDNRDKVNELLNVAVKLANSMRPIDSITAALMLKFCMMSPVINDIIDEWNVEHSDSIPLRLTVILLQQLQHSAKMANENIIYAVSKHSLYGYIYCIRSILSCGNFSKTNNEAWRAIIANIIDVCLSLNTAVSSVVNNSSPEGHFPMDLNKKYLNVAYGESELMKVTPQMVLLCSWRTVKEVSLLFGYLMMNLPINDDGDFTYGLLSEIQIIKIGDHLVTLLCETKHRGAFEQAHVGFEQLCTRLWKLKCEKLNQLPKVWLYQLLMAITGLAPGNSKLCATRRSAGVPFMVQALITSDPSLKNKKGIAFHSTMRILLGLMDIEDENTLQTTATMLIDKEEFFSSLKNCQDYLYQYSCVINAGSTNDSVTIVELKTHVLNILRALFKHAQLRDLANFYAAEGLIIAVKNYDKKTWAERNAATLLFSALIIRIFGVQRTKDYVNLTLHNKMTGRIFFEKYSQLLPFMLDKLKLFIGDAHNNPIRPSIQAILLVLSRLYISTNAENSNAQWKIDEFVKLVSKSAKSIVWTTRELAARAIVPLLTETTVCSFINQLIDDIEVQSNNLNSYRWNLIHGYILQCLEIAKSSLLKSSTLLEINLEKFLKNSLWIIKNKCWSRKNSLCYPLAAAYIDLIYEFIKIFKHKSDIFPYVLCHGILNESIVHLADDKIKHQVGREFFEYSTVKFFINWQLALNLKYPFEKDEWLNVWSKILSHTNTQVQIVGWSSVITTISQGFYSQNNDESSSHFDVELLSIAVNQACDTMKKNIIIDLDLQAAIQDALYQIYIENECSRLQCQQIDKNDQLCTIILSSLVENRLNRNASTLKLLGKMYGEMLKSCSYNHNKQMQIEQLSRWVYEIFCDNSWTGSSSVDCRLAIANVINDIYVDVRNNNLHHSKECILDWWTVLLHLIVDDNADVRRMGTLALVNLKLLPDDNYHRNYKPLDVFFRYFSHIFCNDNDAAFAAYFYWSTSLSNDDFEMDDSDVFNKCYNYEGYEPLRISEICGDYVNECIKNKGAQFSFSDSVQRWLSKKLNLPILKCKDVETLTTAYKHNLPSLDNNLFDVLDATYNEKLLQHLTFQNIAQFTIKCAVER